MTSVVVQTERSFGVNVVEKVIKDVLDAYLHNVKYDSFRSAYICRDTFN